MSHRGLKVKKLNAYLPLLLSLQCPSSQMACKSPNCSKQKSKSNHPPHPHIFPSASAGNSTHLFCPRLNPKITSQLNLSNSLPTFIFVLLGCFLHSSAKEMFFKMQILSVTFLLTTPCSGSPVHTK